MVFKGPYRIPGLLETLQDPVPFRDLTGYMGPFRDLTGYMVFWDLTGYR